MALDAEKILVLRDWLADLKGGVPSLPEKNLLKEVRTRRHAEGAITALELVASRQTERLDRMQEILAVLVAQAIAAEADPA